MTQAKKSEIIKRALMTAVEGFFSVLVPEVALILSNGIGDIHQAWAIVAPILGAAVGAGISAGWNYYLEHKED